MPRRVRPVTRASKRQIANAAKSSRQDCSVKEDRIIESEDFIPLLPVVEERRGGHVESKKKKKKFTMKTNKNCMNDDFIPLSCPETSSKREEKKCLDADSCDKVFNSPSKTPAPQTIVIDDIDDDLTCEITEVSITKRNVEKFLMNDSIEIIEEKPIFKNLNKKRKSRDDNIEIYQESFDTSGHVAKKAKVVPSCSKSTVRDTSNALQRCSGDDDEIVIIGGVEKMDNIILEDVPQGRGISASVSERKKNRWFDRKQSDDGKSKSAGIPFAFEDTIGTNLTENAQYKSPLSSVDNSSIDSPYFNTNGNNIYNPNRKDVEKTGLRPVIIDGNNVAFGHGGKTFSTRGLEICINYFVKRGHMVVAFIPLFRRHTVPESDREVLDALQTKRQLTFTPSRYLHGRRVASYDDRFIVQCAAELGGVVVSTDNYRDLVNENEAWRETIEKRLLMFTWVGDILMFPDDPNGRNGPRLEEFLRFPK